MTTAQHRLRPAMASAHPARREPAREVTPGIWMSEGLSNSYLLTTAAGRIIVNTGMGFESGLHKANFDDVDQSPTRYVIVTQGHFDHVGGVDTFLEPGTDLVAQANFAVWRSDNERLQAFRTDRSAFAFMDRVMDGIGEAKAHGWVPGQSRPEPTITFDDRLELELGGRRLQLIATPGGETTDSLVIWLPDEGTLLSGNMFGPLFGHVPNLVTLRGDRYRDALAYVASLDTVLELNPERIVTGHFDPIEGAALIAAEITAMRDATRYVHDATVEGMNRGADVHTLMREIRLPEQYDVGEGYGTVAWNVRAIWENYAGWFHHTSTTELYSTPSTEVAPDVVGLAGADALVGAAQARLAASQPAAAIHLTDLVLAAEPDHASARSVAIEAHQALLAESGNFWETAWLQRAIERLEAAR
jgi:alkyl sulfatase BDS1-like metallo-beta-lactamase superfamily hydrolase